VLGKTIEIMLTPNTIFPVYSVELLIYQIEMLGSPAPPWCARNLVSIGPMKPMNNCMIKLINFKKSN